MGTLAEINSKVLEIPYSNISRLLGKKLDSGITLESALKRGIGMNCTEGALLFMNECRENDKHATVHYAECLRSSTAPSKHSLVIADEYGKPYLLDFGLSLTEPTPVEDGAVAMQGNYTVEFDGSMIQIGLYMFMPPLFNQMKNTLAERNLECPLKPLAGPFFDRDGTSFGAHEYIRWYEALPLQPDNSNIHIRAVKDGVKYSLIYGSSISIMKFVGGSYILHADRCSIDDVADFFSLDAAMIRKANKMVEKKIPG